MLNFDTGQEVETSENSVLRKLSIEPFSSVAYCQSYSTGRGVGVEREWNRKRASLGQP